MAREVGGELQRYTYDKRGQLLAVLDGKNRPLEQYTYDKAGNILEKVVDGVRTSFTYDKANQLVSSECNGKVTKYEYDAAGRLVKEGNREYQYGWLDKVLQMSEGAEMVRSYSYHMDGQLASASDGRRVETFLWDGLALIRRDGTNYLNEPAITGGNPVMAGDKVLFNDLLGSTLGAKSAAGYAPSKMTAFGESADTSVFFTGKPQVDGLGYAFLFCNYRSDQGKWQTADPLGYPDGWNNFAYVNNGVTTNIDWLGGCVLGIPIECGEVVRRETYTQSRFAETVLDHTFTCGGSKSKVLEDGKTFSGSLNFPVTWQGTGIDVSISYSYTTSQKTTYKNPFTEHSPLDPHKSTGSHQVILELFVTATIEIVEYECGRIEENVLDVHTATKERTITHPCVLE